MNKTAIKNYAVWARVQLIEAAKQRAYAYAVTADGENRRGLETVDGRLLTPQEKSQRDRLIDEIGRKGYAQVMEEAAYTWFDRFIALRFMEVNGYLPAKVRVFTDENGAFRPQILREAMTVELEGLAHDRVLELLERQDNEALYKYLLITQCNALNTGLPYMFERIANWTELLFPPKLLRADSVIGRLVSDIPAEDWTDAVQIIGWLYQYYNSELKDETFALLKKNVKITKERIPAATQLFTPDWIVRYMIENSLGRLWLEGHPDAGLRSSWRYYLDEAEQAPAVEEQLKKLRSTYAAVKPEEIKVIDPCMGSGHILVYAFDVLMQIYLSAGWTERDAARSIVENNLYGLDIDDRAGQLAYFAVMMKARRYSRRILNGEVKPHVLAIRDTGWMTEEFITYAAGGDAALRTELTALRDAFRDAKEYGSILTVPPLHYAALYERVDIIRRSYTANWFEEQHQIAAAERLLPLVEQAEILAQHYDVVVTNPPYMGSSGMSAKLSDFVKKNYPDSKSDLFAVFIERCRQMTKKNGYQAMITQHAWMFLSSFEKLRTKLLADNDIINMAHLGARAFEEVGGEVVQTTSFVMRKSHIADDRGVYCRLIEPTTQQGKEELFLAGENRYAADQSNFAKIPGSPVAYWVSEKFFSAFDNGVLLKECAISRVGLQTSNNNQFLRVWFECEYANSYFDCNSLAKSEVSAKKWYPHNKGGTYRKWYGNHEYVINYQKGGYELSSAKGAATIPLEYTFRSAVTYSRVTSGKPSFRLQPNTFIFDSACVSSFCETVDQFYLMGLLNTKIVEVYLGVLAPTLNTQPGDIAKLPILVNDDYADKVESLACKNVEISKIDWDAYETSWDFKRHPLV